MTIKQLLTIPKMIAEGYKTRLKIEKAIEDQVKMIAYCEIEKARNRADIKRFCQIWTAQKDYQKNIEMLKKLL